MGKTPAGHLSTSSLVVSGPSSHLGQVFPFPGFSPLLPRGSRALGRAGEPAAPTSLPLQLPVVGDPVAGVRLHQEGARHGALARVALCVRRRPRAARPTGAGRVRSLAQRAASANQRAARPGRGGAAGRGIGPRPGQVRGPRGRERVAACPTHGTCLARTASHADPGAWRAHSTWTEGRRSGLGGSRAGLSPRWGGSVRRAPPRRTLPQRVTPAPPPAQTRNGRFDEQRPGTG